MSDFNKLKSREPHLIKKIIKQIIKFEKEKFKELTTIYYAS